MARTITATDPTTGEVFKRRTEHDYTVCRVERMDAVTATVTRRESLELAITTNLSRVEVYEASARVTQAWSIGATPDERDLETLRKTPVPGRNHYNRHARHYLDDLEIDRMRGDMWTPDRYEQWAKDCRAAAAKYRADLDETPEVPAKIVAVTWHRRMDLALKVKQLDPRTTVVYLNVA